MTSSAHAGHLLRVLDLARDAVACGHRVVVHAPPGCAALVAAAGAEHAPFRDYVDIVDLVHAAQARRPRWLPFGPYSVWHALRAIRSSARVLVDELTPLVARHRSECVVYDVFAFGASYAAERAGIPSAAVGNPAGALTADGLPLIFRTFPLLRHGFRWPALTHAAIDRLVPLGRLRDELGLPRRPGRAELLRAFASDDLHIVMAHRGFSPAVPLRARQVFAGTIAFEAQSTGVPVPPIEPGTILVSTTTTGHDGGLLRAVLEALAPLEIPVLATAASASDLPTNLPAHVRVVPFIPHDRVLPHVRAIVTHGGWGTVGRALRHGVRPLIVPLFGDQPSIAAQAVAAGLAHTVARREATPAKLRAAVQALLADDGLAVRVRQAAAEIAALRGAHAGVRALEALVARGAHGPKDR